MTKCTCMTKTPELAFHKDDCEFKVAWRVYYDNLAVQNTTDHETENILLDNISELYEE